MRFEWNSRKAASNLRKHHVSFYEAVEVFDDELSATVPDPDHSAQEHRFLIFGTTYRSRHLVVSYTERDDAIRIISAREMTFRERKAYEA